jgi:hypothetical protein
MKGKGLQICKPFFMFVTQLQKSRLEEVVYQEAALAPS